jgi:hypothetical protein
MTTYFITERLIIDDEVGFDIDLDRCVELINHHRNVAVASWTDARYVLRTLGMTDASINILFKRAAGGVTPAEIEQGLTNALPR